ncbi:MAG: methyl-accepting chemotaxis protein, partial [Balneolales bacterium]|nr:methyl-accepting chemotaxis protein [Balneolales bacterium]
EKTIHSVISLEQQSIDAQNHAKEILNTQTLSALSETQSILNSLGDYMSQKAETAEHSLNVSMQKAIWILGIVCMVVVLLGVLFSNRLAHSIGKPILRIVSEVSSATEQVRAASSQLSSSSQQLAEGTTEQASSMEETSASLNEIASMTNQNTDRAQIALELAKQTLNVTEKGKYSMERMQSSIHEVVNSARESSQIIKTIDDIAFQTNLLALNAAVEAARAGEAGKGFSVVAEEVRNLARSATEAANNTASLIKSSVENSEQSAKIVEEVETHLNEIDTSTEKVNGLLSEISSASLEQNEGTEQINIAIAQVDQVTQSNASTAEESAASSEQLNAQAETLMESVSKLKGIIEGIKSNRVVKKIENKPTLIANPNMGVKEEAFKFDYQGEPESSEVEEELLAF